MPATIDELSRVLRPKMTAVTDKFGYVLEEPVPEEDLRQYLQDPIEALPPSVTALLPRIGIVLAPYLERTSPKGQVTIVKEKPADTRLRFSASVNGADAVTLFFTTHDEQVSDYHYYFYDELATLLATRWPEKAQMAYEAVLREELSGEVHGEVDEKSWHLKQALLRKPKAARREGKAFREYAARSFADTMTLYLHGICCDIDVESGPRQLPTRYLRKRLEVLKGLFPPPEGHAVFPEDLTQHHHRH